MNFRTALEAIPNPAGGVMWRDTHSRARGCVPIWGALRSGCPHPCGQHFSAPTARREVAWRIIALVLYRPTPIGEVLGDLGLTLPDAREKTLTERHYPPGGKRGGSFLHSSGGKGGIRTLGWVAPSLDFESSTIDHSATFPLRLSEARL